MSSETLRPSATVSAPSSVTGAATAHQATNDDSDSTYCTGNVVLAMDTTAAPAGSVVKQERIRLRGRADSLSTNVTAYLLSGSVPGVFATLTKSVGTSITNLTGAYEPAGTLRAPLDDMRVSVQAGALGFRSVEVYVDRIYVEQPVVSLDAITEPIEDSSSIAASFEPTLDSDGGPVTHQRWWVTDDNDSDAVVFDTGVIAGASTTQLLGPLANGDYTVHVEIAQTVNGFLFWSDADSQSAVTIDVEAVELDGWTVGTNDGWIYVAFTRWTDGPAWDVVQVERSDDGEASWVPVWGATLVTPDDPDEFSVADHFAPIGVQVVYRMRGIWFDGENPVVGEWTVTTPISWTSDDVWVKVPGRPELNMTVCMEELPTMLRHRRRVSHRPSGRPDPIVVSDVRSWVYGSMTLQVSSQEQADALSAVLDASPTILLQAPPRWPGWGSRWISLAADEEQYRILRRRFNARLQKRAFVLEYEQVALPSDPLAGVL